MRSSNGFAVSTDIFLEYIDLMLKELFDSGMLFKIGDTITGLTGYADNTKVTTDKVEKVQKILNMIEKYCLKYNIQVNGVKTEWMKLGETPLTNCKDRSISPRPAYICETFKLGGVFLKKVAQFKFLGMWLTSNGKEIIQKKIEPRHL